MIDLHSHILPNIDDGAKDDQAALEMAKQAVAHGIRIVAATPHYLNLSWEFIQQKTAEFNSLLDQNQIDLEVVSGAELFVDPNIINMEKELIPTYNATGKYALIEFPMLELPVYTDDVLFSLKVKGITPIIAHPERYRAVIENPNKVIDWIDAGCLIQMNSGSLIGTFGKKIKQVSEIMIQNRMVHFIASDAHSTGQRGFHLNKCVETCKRLIAEKDVDKLVKINPSLVIAGEPIDIPDVIRYRSRRRFWLFR